MDFTSIFTFISTFASGGWGIFSSLFFWLLSTALDPATYRALASLGWWGTWLGYWLGFAVLGTLLLYVGFGFAVTCQDAYREKRYKQKKVLYIDAFICCLIFALDVLLNIVVYSFVFWDFRPSYVFKTISRRLTKYNESSEGQEWAWRKHGAHLFAAFLDIKDIDHIKGFNVQYVWLN
jgi:hypothetical protein